MLLALLFCIQDADLDALGHPDPVERARATRALRRPDALPLLLRGLLHTDPEIRGRSNEILRALSPLAWVRTSKKPLDVLREQLTSPTPSDAVFRSHDFLRATLPVPRPFAELLQEQYGYGQRVLCVGDLGRADLSKVLASYFTPAIQSPDDVVFHCSEGVIWAGYRRDLAAAPDLLGWLLERLDDPETLALLAQLLPRGREHTLLDDPRPEAVDLLLCTYAFRTPDGPLDPRLAPRLTDRLRSLDPVRAKCASVVLSRLAPQLGATLMEGLSSPNRVWRHLSATIVARTPGARADGYLVNRLLRDPEKDIRREAVRATLARVKPEEWDCAALLETVEALDYGEFLVSLRESRNLRLQAAAVESFRRTPRASHFILEDCDDPAILDAAVLVVREKREWLWKSTSVLRRMTETSDDPEPRDMLRHLFTGSSDEGERAAYALGGLPAGEILGFLEERLTGASLWNRQGAVLALRRLGSRVAPDSCLLGKLRTLLRDQAEVEPDPAFRDQLTKLAEAPEFVEHAPHKIPRLKAAVFACGGGLNCRPQGGWRMLPGPTVYIPDWK